MRRLMKILICLGVVGILASTAGAVGLQAGYNSLKFLDASHLYNPPINGGPYTPVTTGEGGTPFPIPYTGPGGTAIDTGPVPIPGQENRAVFTVTSIALLGQSPYFSSGTTELTGLFYDLEILAVTPIPTGFVIDMGRLGRNPLVSAVDDVDGDSVGGITGGVIEIWEDVGPVSPFSYAPGPGAWVEGGGPGGRDAYPNVNLTGESLFAQLAFVDLAAPLLEPGVPLAPNTVYRETVNLTTGTGEGRGFLNLFNGAPNVLAFVDRGLYGISPSGVPMDVSFQANYVFAPDPSYNPAFNPIAQAGWVNQSDDPAEFYVLVPEPVTLLAVGMSVAGLGAYIRKRRWS